MKSLLPALVSVCVILPASWFPARGAILGGPVTNAANGHVYYLLTPSTWTAAEGEALSLRGHLATIRSAAENQWVLDTFGAWTGTNLLWIGLTDLGSPGTWRWANGEPASFQNWSPVEPSGGDEHYVYMYPHGAPVDAWKRYPGTWNNYSDQATEFGGTWPIYGVVEVPPPTYWRGGAGQWSDPSKWSPAPPAPGAYVIIPAGSSVTMDVPDAEAGGLSLAAGSALNVQAGAVLNVLGTAISQGSITIRDGGAMAAGGLGSGGYGLVIQDGWFTVEPEGQYAIGGIGSGGVGFQQTGGQVVIDGTVSIGSVGSGGFGVVIQDGWFDVGAGGNVVAGGSLGSGGYGFQQTGGHVAIDGAVAIGGIGTGGYGVVIQDGWFDVGAGGNVVAIRGIGSGGVGLEQTGGYVTIDGTVAIGSIGSGGVGIDYTQTGGDLGGSGIIDGSLLADGGYLSPGASPGTLTITSNFTQHAGSTLRLQIAGRQPGQFDQLQVGGTVQLEGRLELSLLDSFAPDIGEQFPLLVTTNLTGAFTNILAPQGISVSCTSTGVVPVVTGVVPTTILGPVLSGGNAVFTFGTVSNRSYTVESSATLSPASWQVCTNLTGSGMKMSCLLPLTNGAHRFFRVRQP